MRQIRLAILCATLLFPNFAHSETVYGIGQGMQKSCADFVVAKGNLNPGTMIEHTNNGVRYVSEGQEYMQWAFGFITGANEIAAFRSSGKAKQVQRLSASGMDLWLRNYCNKSPNASFMDAVIAFAVSEGMFP